MLEACEMFPSFIRIAQTLQGTRKPKFSRGMKRIQFQRVLEGGTDEPGNDDDQRAGADSRSFQYKYVPLLGSGSAVPLHRP